MQTTSAQVYREEGKKARDAGLTAQSNPYKNGTEAAALWNEGFENNGRAASTSTGFKINFGF